MDSTTLPAHVEAEYSINLANLVNASKVWGEDSSQYRECRQLAESVLLQKSNNASGFTATRGAKSIEDLVSRLNNLVLSSGS